MCVAAVIVRGHRDTQAVIEHEDDLSLVIIVEVGIEDQHRSSRFT